jgi:hypothetical protein
MTVKKVNINLNRLKSISFARLKIIIIIDRIKKNVGLKKYSNIYFL